MKKQFILYHIESREIAKRKGVPIIHTGRQPPIWDHYPKGFRQSDGYRYEEIHEVCVDPSHRGPPKYIQKDSQCARFSKIISRQESKQLRATTLAASLARQNIELLKSAVPCPRPSGRLTLSRRWNE